MIVVVSADPNEAETLASLARQLGYRAAIVPAGADLPAASGFESSLVMITDWDAPETSGAGYLAELSRRRVQFTAIVVASEATVSQAVAAMRLGAVDFLAKPVRLEEFQRAIETAVAHDTRRREDYAKRNAVTALYSRLSPRERQVATLVSSGQSS